MKHRIKRTSPSILLFALLAAIGTMWSAGAQAQMDNQPASIPFLLPEQMPAADARIAGQNYDAVARSAKIYGFTLDSSYSYREIACPFAPHDLLLAYESDLPNGAISRFTAVLSREGKNVGEGYSPVQIIPIIRFGVVPFVPASSNPHSIAVFNQAVDAAPLGRALLSDMQSGQQPLLLRGLCYLAMIGTEPAALQSVSLDAATINAPLPTLQFLEKGRVGQVVSIRNSPRTYQVWNLTFSPKGRLVTATREEHPVEPTVPVLEAAAPASPSIPSKAGESGAPHMGLPQSPEALAAPQPSLPAVPQEAATPQRKAPSTATMAPAAPTAMPSTAASVAAPPPAPTPAETIAAPRQPETPSTATIGAASQPTAPSTKAMSSPEPASTTAAPQPTACPTPPPAAAPQPAPSATAVIASPQPASAPTPVIAIPQPATPSVAVVRSRPVAKAALPEPPHRFIPDPPLPPSRIIPASALQSPPHLPQ